MNTEPLRVLHVITGLGLGGAENMLTSLVLCSTDALQSNHRRLADGVFDGWVMHDPHCAIISR